MEDGSKSTDPANADKFKKPKKQKLGEAAKKKAGKQKKSEEESSEDDDDEPKLKKGPTAWGLYVVAECKRLKEEDSSISITCLRNVTNGSTRSERGALKKLAASRARSPANEFASTLGL